MPTTSKFCTVDAAKAHLNTADSYTDDDAALEQHIKQATALIRSFTRRDWERGTFVDFFSTRDINVSILPARGVARFTLKEKPLQSITSIKFAPDGEWTDAEALGTSLYEVDLLRNSFVIYPNQMRTLARSLRVEYVAGYEADVTDTDLLLVDTALETACAVQAAHTFRRMINETQGSTYKQNKAGIKQYRVAPSGLVMEAQAMLRGKASIMVGSS